MTLSNALRLAACVGLVSCRDDPVSSRLPSANVSASLSASDVSMVEIGGLGGWATYPSALNDAGQVAGTGYLVDGGYHAFLWQNGTTTDLGSLPDGALSSATAINNLGQVVGVSGSRAFIWQNGVMTDLGMPPGAEWLRPVAINDLGQVVGNSLHGAFLWQAGTITDLGTLPGEWYAQAVRINNLGQVVGVSGNRAFIWQNGAMTESTLEPVYNTLPADINDLGQVVGTSDNRAFLWQNGATTTLSDVWSNANDINNLGQIVGFVAGFGDARAYSWQDGVATNLGTLGSPYAHESIAIAVNDAGQVLGFSTTNLGPLGRHVFLWQKGTIIDLGTLGSGTFTQPVAINNHGQAIGYNYGTGGSKVTAILWTVQEMAKSDQTIDLAPFEDHVFGDSPFTASATASSGLPVTLAASGNCTVSGITVTLIGAGSCTITADQAGDAEYNPASSVHRTFAIAKASQTITFAPLANKTYGAATFTVSATATSGLSVKFSASGNCTITGAEVSLTGAGSCTITADQGGNADYTPATRVVREFQVDKATPIINWSPSTPIAYGQAISSAQLNATANGVGGVALDGTYSYSPAVGAILGPGAQTLSVTFTPVDQTNYSDGSYSVSIAVQYNTAVGHTPLQPINTPPDAMSVFKIGRTIAVKFQLFLTDGVAPVSTAVATIAVNKVSDGTPSDVNEDVVSTVPNQGLNFRYDAAAQQYIFNLGTTGWTAGTYRITVSLDDGTTFWVDVGAR